MQRLPVAFFDRTRSGDLTSHLSNDVSQLQMTLTSDLVQLAGNLITLVCGIALAIIIDWRLTAVVVLLLMLVMSFFIVNGKRLRNLNRASLDALSEAMGTMSEAFANIRLGESLCPRSARGSTGRRKTGAHVRPEHEGQPSGKRVRHCGLQRLYPCAARRRLVRRA